MDTQLDGNAAGGILQEIFPFEMALVQATCAGCGSSSPIGALTVYWHGMGTVLRCSSCDAVLIRIARIQKRYLLDMRGVHMLQISAATEP